MVDIVADGAATAMTDEQFEELLALSLSWEAYCRGRFELDHAQVIDRLLNERTASAPSSESC
jgi:hypothetical protein